MIRVRHAVWWPRLLRVGVLGGMFVGSPGRPGTGAAGFALAQTSQTPRTPQASLAPPPAADLFVRTQRGDTLLRLARRFGTSVERLREDNGIADNVLRPGQKLLVREVAWPPKQRASPFRPRPPLAGASAARIVSGFGEQTSARNRRVVRRNTGLELTARAGAPVLGADHGVVRFLGEIPGLGQVAIVEHAGGWRTVYGPLDPERPCVEVGEIVRRGQTLGAVGAADPPLLHFEIRKGNEPVDPRPYLRW
jgi:lipoprotein YgeR